MIAVSAPVSEELSLCRAGLIHHSEDISAAKGVSSEPCRPVGALDRGSLLGALVPPSHSQSRVGAAHRRQQEAGHPGPCGFTVTQVCGREQRSVFLTFLTVELQVEGPVCPVSWLSGSDTSSPLFQRVV